MDGVSAGNIRPNHWRRDFVEKQVVWSRVAK